MRPARTALKIGALATLAVASALLFAFVRAHFSQWSGWGAASPPATQSASPPDERGVSVRWQITRAFGALGCSTDAVDTRANPTALNQPGLHVGASAGPDGPPRWTFPAERGNDLVEAGDVVVDSGMGWPLPCLAMRLRLTSRIATEADGPMLALMGLKPGEVIREFQPVYGRFVSNRHEGWRSVLYPDSGYWPTRVLWPGLAANTAVFALILAAPFLLRRGFVFARRRRRARGGRCVACGYDRRTIGAATPCPECGAPSPAVAAVR